MDIFEMLNKKKRRADFSSMPTHPKFFFREGRIEELKELIKRDPLYKRFYHDILTYANETQMELTPKQSDKNFGFVWRYAAYLPLMGAAMLLEEGESRFKYISRWTEEFISYSFSLSHPDLEANLSAISTCLIVDWFYEKLPKSLIEKIREKVFELGDKICEYAAQPYRNGWNKSVLQNHGYIAMSTLGIIGLTFYEEDMERCGKYVNMAVNRFDATFEMMGDDGCFHEGFGYWFYGFLPSFTFFHMLKENTNINYFEEPWFKQVPDYLLFHYFAENHFSPQAEYFAFSDDYGYKRTKECMIRLIAGISDSNELQYLADMTYEKKLSTYHGSFLNLFWNKRDLKAISPRESNYKTSRLFENYGYFMARSEWSGDEACLGIHCGVALGKKWQRLIKTVPFFEVGAGHTHPDAGHFILFGEGQMLLRDDQYAYDKKTVHHNTLMINDAGQMGDNIQWFHQSRYYLDSKQDIIYTRDTEDYILSVADLKDAYGSHNGEITCLKRYYMLLKKENCLIIYDKVRANRKNKISAYFWPWSQTVYSYGDNKYFIPGEKANMKIICFPPAESGVMTKAIPTRYFSEERKAIYFDNYAFDVDKIYGITYNEGDKEPRELKAGYENGIICAELKNVTYTINTENMSVSSKLNISLNNEDTARPIALFSNGRIIEEFNQDIKEYAIPKLPWQTPNYLFFTGKGNPADSEYLAKVFDECPKGVGEIPIKGVTANSYYLNCDCRNTLIPNETMWTSDQPGDYIILETKDVVEISALKLVLGLSERFKYKIKVESSLDGKNYITQYMGAVESESNVEIPFPKGTKAGYIKITNLGNQYNTFLNIVLVGLN